MEEKKVNPSVSCRAAQGDAAVGVPDLPRLNILLVEDNAVNQTFALMILRRYGHRVKAVSDGRKAIEELCKASYDLVLMDIRMPGMSGDEAARSIRKADSGVLDPEIPIIAMTAHSTPEDVQSFMDAGMDGFIGKPMTWEMVLHAIRETLVRRERLPG
ncbi:CheY-like chemotaxis protein [Desulfobaculum xiamenense]|uniref:CheY-like chemotaxis protein n=1 Tax=Desulfobaculum xiamenense TaxID=995050 RepID=A0A846QQN5_9BACT|nr:response regulator [Desulfobaculum xiamenense]NJB67705.1 CheY-like chemotaxis protein [Desulfobaculum xiamenense]